MAAASMELANALTGACKPARLVHSCDADALL